jgi:hypothetical protein
VKTSRRRAVPAAGRILVVVLMGCAAPRSAFAQPPRGSIELTGAFTWTGGYAAGSVSATETPNAAVSSSPFVLFQSDSRLLAAPGLEARAGVYVMTRLLVSATFSYSGPTLRTHLSADFEGAPATDADTRVSSYLIGGSAEYQFRAGRWRPFLSGVVGQVRQIPDGGEVLTGVETRGGGGLRYAMTHGRHPLAIRGEVLAAYRTHAIAFDQKHHVLPIVTAGLAWRF